MGSLVLELQEDALNHHNEIEVILQKALVVSRKLSINSIKDWITLELQGYETQEVPEYRVVNGSTVVHNPYNGYIPLVFPDKKMTKKYSCMSFNQPISEIQEMYQMTRGKGNNILMTYTPEVEKSLMSAMSIPLRPFLEFNLGILKTILSRVRNIILEWSLQLEQEGILGQGMSFTPKEVKHANEVIYNINNNFNGSVSGSQLQLQSDGSIQASVKFIDINELKNILKAIKSTKDLLDLNPSDATRLAENLEETNTIIIQEPQSTGKIIKSIQSIKNILEGAAGNVIATGILHQLNQVIS